MQSDYESNFKEYKMEVSNMTVDVESMKKYIIELESINQKKDIQIENLRARVMGKDIIESKLNHMGNKCFDYVSYLMTKYSDIITKLDVAENKLKVIWQQIKNEVKDNLIDKNHLEFIHFFRSLRDLVGDYDFVKNKVNLSIFKNCIEDYEIKKLNLDIELEKQRIKNLKEIDLKKNMHLKESEIDILNHIKISDTQKNQYNNVKSTNEKKMIIKNETEKNHYFNNKATNRPNTQSDSFFPFTKSNLDIKLQESIEKINEDSKEPQGNTTPTKKSILNNKFKGFFAINPENKKGNLEKMQQSNSASSLLTNNLVQSQTFTPKRNGLVKVKIESDNLNKIGMLKAPISKNKFLTTTEDSRTGTYKIYNSTSKTAISKSLEKPLTFDIDPIVEIYPTSG